MLPVNLTVHLFHSRHWCSPQYLQNASPSAAQYRNGFHLCLQNEALHQMQTFVQHSLHPQAAQLVSSDNALQRTEIDQLLAR